MKLHLFRLLIPYVVRIGSARFRRRILDWIPWRAVQQLKGISDIMDSTSRKIFRSKKEALGKEGRAILNEVGSGKDIISVLRAVSPAYSVQFSFRNPNNYSLSGSQSRRSPRRSIAGGRDIRPNEVSCRRVLLSLARRFNPNFQRAHLRWS